MHYIQNIHLNKNKLKVYVTTPNNTLHTDLNQNCLINKWQNKTAISK